MIAVLVVGFLAEILGRFFGMFLWIGYAIFARQKNKPFAMIVNSITGPLSAFIVFSAMVISFGVWAYKGATDMVAMYCDNAKSDLANLAIAQEAYFTDFDKFVVTGDGSNVPGFKKLPETNIKLSGVAKEYFIARASHPNCDKDDDGKPDVFTWNSAKGGAQW